MDAEKNDLYAWLQQRALGYSALAASGVAGHEGFSVRQRIREPSCAPLAVLLFSQLEQLMFGCGNTLHAEPETVALLYTMFSQFLESLVHASLDHAATTGARHAEAVRGALTRDAGEGFGTRNVLAVLHRLNPSHASSVEQSLHRFSRMQAFALASISSGSAEENVYSGKTAGGGGGGAGAAGAVVMRPMHRTEAEAAAARTGGMEKWLYDSRVVSGMFIIAQPMQTSTAAATAATGGGPGGMRPVATGPRGAGAGPHTAGRGGRGGMHAMSMSHASAAQAAMMQRSIVAQAQAAAARSASATVPAPTGYTPDQVRSVLNARPDLISLFAHQPVLLMKLGEEILIHARIKEEAASKRAAGQVGNAEVLEGMLMQRQGMLSDVVTRRIAEVRAQNAQSLFAQGQGVSGPPGGLDALSAAIAGISDPAGHR